MNLSILYRGPLSSCNYACDYCPFAKRSETPAELAHDRACLERFAGWVGGPEHGMVRELDEYGWTDWHRTGRTTIYIGVSPEGEISS